MKIQKLVLISTIAAIITIFVFITGINNLPQLFSTHNNSQNIDRMDSKFIIEDNWFGFNPDKLFHYTGAEKRILIEEARYIYGPFYNPTDKIVVFIIVNLNSKAYYTYQEYNFEIHLFNDQGINHTFYRLPVSYNSTTSNRFDSIVWINDFTFRIVIPKEYFEKLKMAESDINITESGIYDITIDKYNTILDILKH